MQHWSINIDKLIQKAAVNTRFRIYLYRQGILSLKAKIPIEEKENIITRMLKSETPQGSGSNDCFVDIHNWGYGKAFYTFDHLDQQ
jgi:hypothetical protein